MQTASLFLQGFRAMRVDCPKYQTYVADAHVAFMLKCVLYLRDMHVRGKLSPENQKHLDSLEMDGLLF